MARQQRRSSTVPAPDWWIAAAAAQKRERGLINAQITERARVDLGLATLDESRISRCMTGDVSPVQLLQAISRVLGIPSPVFLPSTMAEARQIAALSAEISAADQLASLDTRIEAMESEISRLPKRQTAPVVSRDGGALAKRARGGVVDRRRGAS